MNLEQINKKIDEGEKIIKIGEKVIEGLDRLYKYKTKLEGEAND